MNKSMYIDMHENKVWKKHNKDINNGYIWMVKL